MFRSFLGNETLKDQIEGRIKAGNLPHAILFQGEDGCGRSTFARLTASGWLADGNNLVVRSMHPDCLELRGTGASGQIPVDAVREVIFETSKSAVSTAGHRAVLLYDAAALNDSSAASLLKTLEEPSEGVVFLLTARSAQDVIETIRSRCVICTLEPIEESLCAVEAARRTGKPIDQAADLSRFFAGKLGLVLHALRDAGFRTLIETAQSFAAAFQKGDAARMLALAGKYEERRQRIELCRCISLCLARGEREGIFPVGARLIPLEIAERLGRNASPKLAEAALVCNLLPLAHSQK